MENGGKFGYFAKDVASEIEVTTSTLRRWAIELEKTGYIFDRNDKQQRIYYERDFKAFRELKKMIKNNVSFTDAIKAVGSTDLTQKNASKTLSVQTDEVRLSKRELEEMIGRAVKTAIQEDREKMFKVFETQLKHVIERRENELKAEIKREQEEKRELLEAAAAAKEQEKKPFWKRLFTSN